MKKLILLIAVILVAACSVDEGFTSNHPMAEPDIFLNFPAPDSIIDEVVTMVIMKGWRCDSISSFRREVSGFSMTCNAYRYSYTVTDKGGHWSVEVN